MDIDDGWGDLSPSLEGIILVGIFDMGDISENPLSSLEAAAETLEENGSLKESALTKEYFYIYDIYSKQQGTVQEQLRYFKICNLSIVKS